MRKNTLEICERCGDKLESWMSFCSSCGTQLIDPPLTWDEIVANGHTPKIIKRKTADRVATSADG